jgi:hypothetical protein
MAQNDFDRVIELQRLDDGSWMACYEHPENHRHGHGATPMEALADLLSDDLPADDPLSEEWGAA